MIVESFHTHLSADSGVAALCKRIWPHWIPHDSEMPAISYRMEGDERQHLMNGVSTLKLALFNVECWSASYAQAHELSEAVESALAGHAGTFGDDDVDHIRLERKFELAETDSKLYRVSMQFFLAYY
jgi:hypothetical protein